MRFSEKDEVVMAYVKCNAVFQSTAQSLAWSVMGDNWKSRDERFFPIWFGTDKLILNLKEGPAVWVCACVSSSLCKNIIF